MSDDEFDNLPDEFADIQGVDWAQLLAGPSPVSNAHADAEGHPAEAPHENSQDLSPISPHSNESSLYFPDDDMDSAFLAELAQVEQRITGVSQVASSSLVNAGMPRVHGPSGNGGSTSSAQAPSGVAPQPQLHGVSELRGPHYLPNQAAGTSSSAQETKNAETRAREDAKETSTIPVKRAHSNDSPHVISPKRKGKMKADNEIQQILSSYEDELTCPICFDILSDITSFRCKVPMRPSVASHVGNPCGHTFCGDCGWQWHVQNKKKACPFCRIDLDNAMPMIPNIAMDNTVEKHVKALALSGAREWEPGGHKFREWDTRKQTWRKGAAKREQQRKKKARQTIKPVTFEVFDVPINWFEVGDNEEDPDYMDSDVELIPRPIQRARRRRG